MPPTNITPGTAIEITALPYSIVVPDVNQSPQDLTYVSSCDPTSYHPLWWYFDVPAHINQISLIISGDNIVYFPSLSLWTGIPPALTQWEINDPIGGNNPFCGTKALNFFWVVPVTPSTRYWIRVTDFDGTADAASILTFNLISQPFVIAPNGSILIRDDTNGFPAVLVGTDGAFLQTPPMAAGELGAVLPTGEFCVDRNDQLGVYVYDSQLNELAFHSFPDGVEELVGNESAFFVLVEEPANARNLQKILADGSLSTLYTLDSSVNNAQTLGVNRAETILYHSVGTNAPVERFDLVNSVPLSNLVASQGTFTGIRGTIMEMIDGNIVVTYRTSFPALAYSIKIFNVNTGALITSHTPSTLPDVLNKIIYWPGDGTPSDPESVYVWIYQNGTTNLSTIRRLSLPDFTTVSEVTDIPGMGVSGNPLVAGTPWAISNSCPLIITRQPINPPITPTTGSIIVQKVVIPSSNETEFNFQAESGLSPSEFILGHGDTQIYDNLNPGIYSILEEENPEFTTIYEVSSGDDPSEINLEAGETITIIVTNYILGSFGGIYKIQPGKRNDTLWVDIEENLTVDARIPNPKIRTALVGE